MKRPWQRLEDRVASSVANLRTLVTSVRKAREEMMRSGTSSPSADTITPSSTVSDGPPCGTHSQWSDLSCPEKDGASTESEDSSDLIKKRNDNPGIEKIWAFP